MAYRLACKCYSNSVVVTSDVQCYFLKIVDFHLKREQGCDKFIALCQ